jgi:hypothetical protein
VLERAGVVCQLSEQLRTRGNKIDEKGNHKPCYMSLLSWPCHYSLDAEIGKIKQA